MLLLSCSCAAHAEDAPKKQSTPAAVAVETAPLFDPIRHMRVSEVEAGMTGYGLSVFSGTRIERFDVEVISVLKNQMGPNHDIVLIRCKGQNLEHSGAVAGMSGSPIYLTDKQGRERMIGAFALGWEFTKDPIAGVRPIEEMLDVPTAKREVVGGEAAKPQAAARNWNALPTMRAAIKSQPAAGAVPLNSGPQLKRLSLPLVASGISTRFLQTMQPLVDRQGGLTLLQSGAASPPATMPIDARLEPGAAIGIPIVRGDLDLAAIGTVTEVLGDRVFAFGHEFNAEGAVDLPMGVGFVHTIIPNQSMSFKLGAMLRTDGAIHSDESVAVAGLIGKSPAMIPVELSVTTPQRREAQNYKFEVVRHPKFTPMGCSMAITQAVLGQSQLPEEFTIDYTLSIEFENGQKLDLANTSTSLTQAMEIGRDLNVPMQLGLENPFAETYVKRITGSMTVVPGAKLAIIETVQPAKSVYKPGETVRVFVTARPWKAEPLTKSADFKLPDDLPDGSYSLTVGDASRFVMDQTRYTPYRFSANNLDDVFSVARELTQLTSRTLYMRLATQQEALSVGRTALPKLPESKRRVLGQPGRPDVLQYTPSYTSQTPWDLPVSGSVDLEIMVARDPSKAARPTAGTPMMPQPQQGPPQQQQPPARAH